jgi:purine-binding chemotaxis protein CheW
MSEKTFLQFRAGPAVYGLPVTEVIEIIRIVAISPVPSQHPDLVGMINLRGRVIPVFDLYLALAGQSRPLSLRMYIIIADVAGEAVGVLVDDVLDVITVPSEQFQVSRALSGGASYTSGVARSNTQLLTILNLVPFLDRAPAVARTP